MNTNQIQVIAPYRYNDTWVFDDENVGLFREPFVVGIPEIIEAAMKAEGIAGSKLLLHFSGAQFPGCKKKLTWIREEFGGNWYKDEAGREGWLCPALFKYFDEAPAEIYADFRLANPVRGTTK